jgi:DNA-binding LacI/PurR family transcriptional regulator
MKIKELFESEGKHVAFCFGRMNPPTIGHKKLMDTMKGIGGDFKIFVSQTQDKKKNPLDYATKIKFIKAMFPEYSSNVVEDTNLNSIVKVATHLYDQGYRHITIVAGSDRISDLYDLLKAYNGVEGKAHGFYKFDTIEQKSSGEREDGAEGVAGVSASNARAAAATGDLQTFADATGAGKYAKPLYNAVRKGMGIADTTEEAAGVGIITKQNTTGDVNKNTPNKNLRAFRL